MKHVAVFRSQFGNTAPVFTNICVGDDPQAAIDYAKRILTEQDVHPFEEFYDKGLNRKILVRVVERSGKGPVEEWGWLSALGIPEVSDTLDFHTEATADATAQVY
jgi:hypothetical protein